MKSRDPQDSSSLSRRQFTKLTVTGSAAAMLTSNSSTAGPLAPQKDDKPVVIDSFDRADTFYHGDKWESLNPGYWKIQGHALRRRVRTRGDRARNTGFPYHYSTHNLNGGVMDTEYESSPPYGMIWRRDWRLSGGFRIEISVLIRNLAKPVEGFKVEPGDALVGICFGAQTRMESWYGGGAKGKACWFAGWRDNAKFGIYDHSKDAPTPSQAGAEKSTPEMESMGTAKIIVDVRPEDAFNATITAQLIKGENITTIEIKGVSQEKITNGYFGVVARGMLDFEIQQVVLSPRRNVAIPAPVNQLRVAYPIGQTLREVDGKWQCRMVAVFRDDGKEAAIRVSADEKPEGGWQKVPIAGKAKIVTNDFRRATAVIDVTLPENPGDKAMYYTVWKDGADVTADPRTGYLGKKEYVGRLPQLRAPYRLCGLSCHAINGEFDGGLAKRFEENWIHDQPAVNAYKFLDEYEFQIMVWEDDVWYLELLLYTTSVDDAYLQIMTAIGGPTSRWQMMRHWNTINPGDHDYGMDDVKGPEQLAIRRRDDLGQDAEYMRRNFQIVQHLISGDEAPSPTANPKRWRAWKMPKRDFTLAIVDSRLWRNSQDTHLWATEGWGKKGDVYDREDPTRSLLGEEQFAWLQDVVTTDTSPLMVVTGINGMHTIWQPPVQNQRNRVVADYAGWVKAGCDRVIELLSGRDGIISVYGDVHNGCIMKNVEHRLVECSFGPIGRTGGRAVKPEFGPKMKDYDGRDLEVVALYHKSYESPGLKARTGPQYWNFLEMECDPSGAGSITLKIRNLIDPPSAEPRGGGFAKINRKDTGRPIASRLPDVTTLKNADVRFTRLNGRPLRGTRSDDSGKLSIQGLVDIPVGTRLLMIATDGETSEAKILKTV